MSSDGTIWITGGSGLLGRAITGAAQTSFGAERVKAMAFTRPGSERVVVDLRDQEAVARAFEEHPPSFIVHTAAERRPDFCENEVEATNLINVQVCSTLARLAREHKAWMIQISTDYVFDGSNPPYLPGSLPNPLNQYGVSKWQGEQAVWDETDDAAVLRIPVLYGQIEDLRESPISIIADQLLNAAGESELVLDDYIVRYPTHTGDLGKVVCELIKARKASPLLRGTFHWSGQERHTRYTMACMIRDLWNLSGPELIPNPAQVTGAPRPHNAHLDRSVTEAIGVTITETQFADGLEAMLAPFKPA